ncbi:unnamed protein product [Phaedon cochleariae]|uniref:Uncharacterized protein n=1 Tax=Phaedon cochleariae TaxID=80249 RepID=A0A9P0DHL3_PHACE|nr:unnamed protein product [Phaedon cochleariae]
MPDRPFETAAPFGVATKRFIKLGFHPELDVSGAMKKTITKVGPGSYNPKYTTCKSKRGMSWKVKVETELFSKFLNYKNATLLHEREFYKSLRGPGTNDVNKNLYEKQTSAVLENKGFGANERFKQHDSTNIPPPDTYFRNLDDISSVTRKQFSKTPTFEWDGFTDRFKSTAPKNTLAANRYHVQDNKGIDTILKKVVSTKGPYELFTGPRDQTTIKNHFGPPSTIVPEYYYVKPSDADVLLKHPSKAMAGKFMKAVRFTKKPTKRHMHNDLSLCYRNPNDPSPATYNISDKISVSASKSPYAFNTSKEFIRPPPNWTVFPGPGRYSPKAPKCMKPKKASWVFLSKLERAFFIPIPSTSYNE